MTMETSTSQHRIENTENRLQLLKTSTVDSFKNRSYQVDGGYVVDNGILPACVNALLVSDGCGGALENYAAQEPIYDPDPDSNGYNDIPFSASGMTKLSDADEKLWKGFRPVYLNSVITDENGDAIFRDAWGNIGASASGQCPDETSGSEHQDSLNFGWCRHEDSGTLTYRSYGRDNVDSATAAYTTEPAQDSDRQIVVSPSEWRDQRAETIKVEITNNTSGNIIMEDQANYSLVLLEFKNGDSSSRGLWFQKTNAGQKLLGTGNVLADDDGNELTPGEKIVLKFTPQEPVPVGEHILLLVGHDGSDLTNDTDFCIDLGDGNNHGTAHMNGACDTTGTHPDIERRLTKKFTVYSRVGVLNERTIEWEIN